MMSMHNVLWFVVFVIKHNIKHPLFAMFLKECKRRPKLAWAGGTDSHGYAMSRVLNGSDQWFCYEKRHQRLLYNLPITCFGVSDTWTASHLWASKPSDSVMSSWHMLLLCLYSARCTRTCSILIMHTTRWRDCHIHDVSYANLIL